MYRRILEIHDGAFGSLIIIIFSYNFLTNKLILYIMRTINQMNLKINMANGYKTQAHANPVTDDTHNE